jgi:hypothetical protein
MDEPIVAAKVSKAKFIAKAVFIGVFGYGSLAMGALGINSGAHPIVLLPIVVMAALWTYLILMLTRTAKHDCGYAVFTDRIEVRRLSTPWLRVEFLRIPFNEIAKTDWYYGTKSGVYYCLVLKSGRRVLLPDVANKHEAIKEVDRAIKGAQVV